MFKLIKYEFLRKYKLSLVTIISTILLNVFLITRGATGSMVFLSFYPMIMSIIYIVDIIKMYSEDLNKKSGYMLFMTPNSGYKIIISKLLTAIIEGFAILILYFIFILINGSYIIYQPGVNIDFNGIIYGINGVLTGSFGFNLIHIFTLLITALLFIIGFITTIYTSMTIRKSIFSEVKFGGVLSFIIFIVLNWVISYISSEIFSLMSPHYDFYNFIARPSATELAYIFLPMNVLSIIQSIILTFSSGYLLEHKINL